jgi:hypothetical protein
MIEVRVRQQHEVDGGRIEPEVAGIIIGDLAAALKQSAVDEDALAGAFDEVARAGHIAIGAMK